MFNFSILSLAKNTKNPSDAGKTSLALTECIKTDDKIYSKRYGRFFVKIFRSIRFKCLRENLIFEFTYSNTSYLLIYSLSHCFYLTLQDDGNLVIRRKTDNKQVWATNSYGTYANKACLQGKLIINH